MSRIGIALLFAASTACMGQQQAPTPKTNIAAIDSTKTASNTDLAKLDNSIARATKSLTIAREHMALMAMVQLVMVGLIGGAGIIGLLTIAAIEDRKIASILMTPRSSK